MNMTERKIQEALEGMNSVQLGAMMAETGKIMRETQPESVDYMTAETLRNQVKLALLRLTAKEVGFDVKHIQ